MDSGVGLEGLRAQARWAASRRGQRFTTAHFVLAMLQNERNVAVFLQELGLGEIQVLAFLQQGIDEPASAVELAMERAHQLAKSQEQKVPTLAHLTLALLKDSRCLAYKLFDRAHGGSQEVIRRCFQMVDGTENTAHDVSESQKPARAKSRRAPMLSTQSMGVERATSPSRTAKTKRLLSTSPQQAMSASMPKLWPKLWMEFEKSAPAKERPKQTPNEIKPQVSTQAFPVASNPEKTTQGFLCPELFPTLSSIGRNLTWLAQQGYVDPVIGREREVEQMLDVLARRRAHHPLLVGPSGVGKTALVEGLAYRLMALNTDARSGNHWANAVIVEMSAGSLVSGASVRGAVTERFRKLCDEISRYEGNIILFIDDIHVLLQGNDGPDDPAGELKAVLSRGHFRCIGATTDVEYRRRVDRDPGFWRRFSRVDIEEPDRQSALQVLKGLASRYAEHHGVTFDESAFETAIDLSVRYIPERHLPDKAISVLDLAAARVRRTGGKRVDEAAIAEVISQQTAVPLERLLMRDGERLLALESELQKRIVGQSGPIFKISEVLRKSAAGFRGKRPLGTFLLLGPTGVGKTETAKAIAESLFPQGSLTRFDMSEFSEAHAVARLLGAPPGYVGHEEGGQLTEAIRRRPYQVLLLDEIEKAHMNVLLAMLPLLDEGHLTDARGRRVDFSHTVIFMTSNLGAQVTKVGGKIGFSEKELGVQQKEQDEALRLARAALPAEFWNRIDEALYFGRLEETSVTSIARKILEELEGKLLREHQATLAVRASAIEALVRLGGFDASLGARPMRRMIARWVESPLAALVLAGKVQAGAQIIVEGADDVVRVRIATKTKTARYENVEA